MLVPDNDLLPVHKLGVAGEDNLLPKSGRVYDLTSSPVDGVFEDRSGTGNDLNLLSGWDISLNGSTDYISVPANAAWDLSGDDYEFTLIFRPDAFGATRCLITSGNPTTAGGWEVLQQSGGTLLIASTQAAINSYHASYVLPAPVVGEWNIYTFRWNNLQVLSATRNGVPVTVTTSVSPTGTYGDPGLGVRIGATFGGTWFYNGDIALVSIKDLSTGNYVAKWVPSVPSGTLTGLPVFDASGNGHHGTPVGCTGGNGEGIPAEVVGLGAYEDAFVLPEGTHITTSLRALGDGENLSGLFYLKQNFFDTHILSKADTGNSTVHFTSNRTKWQLRDTNSPYQIWNRGISSFGGVVPLNTWVSYNLYREGNLFTLYLNGESQGTLDTGAVNPSIQFDLVGGRGGTWFDGYIKDVAENGSLISLSGTTIADKRRTIPQMFLQDWNRGDLDPSGFLYESNFSSAPAGFNTVRATLTSEDNIFEKDDVLDISPTAENNTHSIYRDLALVVGKEYEFRGSFYLPSSNTSLRGFWVMAQRTSIDARTIYGTRAAPITTKDTWLSFTTRLVIPPDGFTSAISINTGNGTSNNFQYLGDVSDALYVRDLDVREVVGDYYIPASTTTPTQDALGNPIARPRGNLLNLTGVAGDYAEIADDASLDVTTAATFATVINPFSSETGLNRFIYHRWDHTSGKRVFLFNLDPAFAAGSGYLMIQLSQIGTVGAYSGRIVCQNEKQVVVCRYNGGAGTIEAWINGAPATITLISGAVPPTLFTTDAPIRIGQGFADSFTSDQLIGQTLLYNIAATDASIQRLTRYLRRFL